jgi:hypothetical protein
VAAVGAVSGRVAADSAIGGAYSFAGSDAPGTS